MPCRGPRPADRIPRSAGPSASEPTQDGDRAHDPAAAEIVGERQLHVAHLVGCLTAELANQLVDLRAAGRAHRMALRDEATRRIHRDLAIERRRALLDRAPALAL